MTAKEIWKVPVVAGTISGVVVALIVSAAGKISPANAAIFLKSFPIPLWVIIIAVFTLIGTVWKLLTHHEPPPNLELYNFQTKLLYISMTAGLAPPEEKRTYPLKCSAFWKNESNGCIDVVFLRYEQEKIPAKSFIPSVLQISVDGQYVPPNHGAGRIAVLPDQEFRAWIAVDENKYTADEIRGAYGNIGTFVFRINGKEERWKI